MQKMLVLKEKCFNFLFHCYLDIEKENFEEIEILDEIFEVYFSIFLNKL